MKFPRFGDSWFSQRSKSPWLDGWDLEANHPRISPWRLHEMMVKSPYYHETLPWHTRFHLHSRKAHHPSDFPIMVPLLNSLANSHEFWKNTIFHCEINSETLAKSRETSPSGRLKEFAQRSAALAGRGAAVREISPGLLVGSMRYSSILFILLGSFVSWIYWDYSPHNWNLLGVLWLYGDE